MDHLLRVGNSIGLYHYRCTVLCIYIYRYILGSPIARHLAEAGHTLTVYNRTKEKAEKLSDIAYVASNIEELTQRSNIIFMIVGYPKDVETVALEIFQDKRKGSIIVDMTTSSPSLAEHLYEMANQKNLHMMDAPVTGGSAIVDLLVVVIQTLKS